MRTLKLAVYQAGASLLVVAGLAFAEETSMPTREIRPPGAAPYPAGLVLELRRTLAQKGPGYVPRTHHLADDGTPLYVNRLIFEDSPYLLQHAHNPVDWYPWGPEAFARAAAEDKPVFLSIGYSTCHWCHVMERESFEDEEIARLLNEKFVCVKVDRERRPDVDEVYMTAVTLVNGSGGWPMSSFLTPAAKPFFGGTYFPPRQFTQLLEQVDAAWHGERQDLLDAANRLAQAVDEITSARNEATELGAGAFAEATSRLLARHDKAFGGFGGAPKFPNEPQLLFLLDRLRRGEAEEALEAVDRTLDAMARGGIYDQVGGGFHRYSTDARWLVPHFEKMLYNQAHLARVYLLGYELTGKAFYARVARQTLDYVLREMTSPEGGFYSATDADSEGEEGLFFLWTPEGLEDVLGEADAQLVAELYGVTPGGNFEGRNILHLERGFDAFAAAKGTTEEALLRRLDGILGKLRQAREEREHPLRDDKVLTAWNGMTITALAAGAETLGETRYLDAARRAGELLWTRNRREDGGLWRLHLGERTSTPGVQEDYAYLAEAFLALYDATGEETWLERTRQLADVMVERFWDDDGGGFFMSAAGEAHLIARPKGQGDGATPSGNSVALRVLARLAARTGEAGTRDRAHATLAAFAQPVGQSPSAFGYLLTGAADLLHGEAGHRQYAAAGKVRAEAHLAAAPGAGYALRVVLRIAEGWHLNAHETLSEEFVPTELSLDGDAFTLGAVRYPEGERMRLEFQDEPLALYQGEVEIKARVAPASAAARIVPVKLRLQACNDEVCLRPEDVVLEVSTAGSG